MAEKIIVLPHPRPTPRAAGVLPVFLPHHGCPHRCNFCAQYAQTGLVPQKPVSLDQTALLLDAQLSELAEQNAQPVDVGFYGGTFTGLPGNWPERLVRLAASWRQRGVVRRIRCSTRPDAVDREALDFLSQAGLDLVELGVQSFQDSTLLAVNRGHTATQAVEGCQGVTGAGLALSIHLMPGLPGQAADDFRADVAAAIAQKPECVRLHPCLVLEGTALAKTYRAGAFAPWSLEATLDALADALLAFWGAGVQVIRVGLAPEDSLAAATLGGPAHPSLGQRAASLALFRHLRAEICQRGGGVSRVHYPRRYQSDVLGWKRERVADWERLGVRELVAWDEDGFGLE